LQRTPGYSAGKAVSTGAARGRTKNRSIATKNSGTKKIASTVAEIDRRVRYSVRLLSNGVRAKVPAPAPPDPAR
jgi:hypothetical protein